MKKIILTFLLCVVGVLGITGCRNNEWSIGDRSDIQIFQEDVTLSIKDGTLTNTGATLILTNKSNKDYEYGNPYELEIKKGENWYKIEVELNFNQPAFILKANESKEIEINWKNGYGKLPKGTYRIIKEIDYEYEEVKYQSFNIAVEFEI